MGSGMTATPALSASELSLFTDYNKNASKVPYRGFYIIKFNTQSFSITLNISQQLVNSLNSKTNKLKQKS